MLFQVYSKILYNVIGEGKRVYYNKKIKKSSNKYKTTCDIIKKLTYNQHSQIGIQELTTDSKRLKVQQDKADAFNNYFSSIFGKISKNNVNNQTNNEKVSTFHYYLEQNYVYPPPSLVIKTFSTKKITSIIKALKTKNSHGFDEISINLLKISAPYICSPLTYICNKSIFSGIFPHCLKFSIIKPIYRKGNKMNPTNYRPI